jgi:hypothetical protein
VYRIRDAGVKLFSMKTLCLALILGAAVRVPALPQKQNGFAGRWDLTVTTPKATYPSWMEVNGGDIRIVGRVSSVHPAKDVKFEGSKVTFTSSEWFGKPTKVDWEFTAAAGKITGTQKRADGTVGQITGVPAPPLNRPAPKAWSKPEALFDGKSLNGWEPDDPSANHWKADNGVLVNEKAGANLRATRKFQDFKLHIEYNCPDHGNSGIYLRGRYEVQVEYEPADANDPLHGMGSIYGFIAPSQVLPKRPGEWETLDITFTGRIVTVVRNGVTTIDRKEIPGITGGAIDSHEAEPGPFYIQGDHTGGMKYRNITVAVPQS